MFAEYRGNSDHVVKVAVVEFHSFGSMKNIEAQLLNELTISQKIPKISKCEQQLIQI